MEKNDKKTINNNSYINYSSISKTQDSVNAQEYKNDLLLENSTSRAQNMNDKKSNSNKYQILIDDQELQTKKDEKIDFKDFEDIENRSNNYLNIREQSITDIPSLETIKYNSNIPKILDSYEYSWFHSKIIFALGITWVLDGYEVTLLSVLSGMLVEMFDISDTDIGICSSVYLAGAVSGSLIFGYFSSIYGRKKLFNVTLLIYCCSVIAICFTVNKYNFFICRFFTGIAVGGEYSAIFSAIDELLPAYIRGRVDLIIDGTWHLGSVLASIAGVLSLETYFNNEEHKETANSTTFIIRILFAVGALVSLPVLYFRSYIPESPRWLLYKGRVKEALEIMKEINKKNTIRKNSAVDKDSSILSILDSTQDEVNDYQTTKISFNQIFYILCVEHTQRFFYALVLMASQAFFYNGVFYTYTLILKTFEGVSKEIVGIYLIPLSVASFIGPILLGHYFDTYSRRKMIFLCNTITMISLIFLAFNFKFKLVSFIIEQIIWFVTFIFASPGASSAHLTVSEIFPLEMRSQALSFFFSIGYGTGGIIAPTFFGYLVDSKNRDYIMFAYILSGVIMGMSGLTSLLIGIDAENKSLEEISDDLRKKKK